MFAQRRKHGEKANPLPATNHMSFSNICRIFHVGEKLGSGAKPALLAATKKNPFTKLPRQRAESCDLLENSREK